MIQRLGLLSLLLLRPLAVPAQAVDVSGKWEVTITISGDTIHGKAGFKQDGGKVTGWLGPSEDDPIPITIVLKDNKLIITTHPQEGRNVAFERCEVTIDRHKMTGAIDGDKGKIEFTRSTPFGA
jgi:hypothetical protein